MQEQQDVTGIVPSALIFAMRLRNINAAELARETGISKAMLSLLLADKQTNTTAVNVSKLARTLRVPTDYLLGLSDDPAPRNLALGEIMMELLREARALSASRQRDLIAIARAFAEENASQ
jgi:transcriptional regulator with XRE-family HTH domain